MAHRLPPDDVLERICDDWVFHAVQRYCADRSGAELASGALGMAPLGVRGGYAHHEYEEDPDLRPYLWDLNQGDCQCH